jgi:hypothetical protein
VPHRGFRRIKAAVITALRSQKLPPGTVHLEWRAIYRCLHKNAPISSSAARVAELWRLPRHN